MGDIGNALSSLQIIEALTSQKFDYQFDGASHDHNKVLSAQVTLEDRRQLSLGYEAVDRETASTVLDVTMNLFQEIAAVGSDSKVEQDDIMKTVFGNLNSTMTDKAAYMIRFGKELQNQKQEILNRDDGLEMLFCTARVLLGLASGAKKALSSFEAEIGWTGKFGRCKAL